MRVDADEKAMLESAERGEWSPSAAASASECVRTCCVDVIDTLTS